MTTIRDLTIGDMTKVKAIENNIAAELVVAKGTELRDGCRWESREAAEAARD